MNQMISRPLIYYVLMAAVRDKLILSLILFMAWARAWRFSWDRRR